MQFEVAEINDIPRAVFADEQSPTSWMLSSFLEDFRFYLPDVLTEIDKARRGEQGEHGIIGDQIEASFGDGVCRLKHLWVKDDKDALVEVELPLAQVESVLRQWASVMHEWQRHKQAA